MRRKHVFTSMAITSAMLMSLSTIGSDVFAGTIGKTKTEIETTHDTRLKEDNSYQVLNGKTDIAYGVLCGVAQKKGSYGDGTEGRNVYDLTETFPLSYRMYFNLYKNGENDVGGIHSLRLGENIFIIEPSGTPDTNGKYDESEWFYPDLAQATNDEELISIINRVTALHGDATSIKLSNDGANANLIPSGQDAAQNGVLTWRERLYFQDRTDTTPPYTYVDTPTRDDANKTFYYTLNLTMNDIVGKPGDKLKVTVKQYYTQGGKNTFTLKDYPEFGTLGYGSMISLTEGVFVIPGYIYIPYEVTFDKNGATGDAPTVPEGEYFTCDNNEVTVPDQGQMTRTDGLELLGWSATKIEGKVTDTSTIADFTEPGENYEIPSTKREDVTLYAVWGKKGPSGTTLNVETRGRDGKTTGKESDTAAIAEGETPLYLKGAKYTLTKANDQWQASTDAGDTRESEATGVNGKTSFAEVEAGKYILRESLYPTDDTDPNNPLQYTGYDSEWRVEVAENNGEYAVTVSDVNGDTQWQTGKSFNEWYWTAVERTAAAGNTEGFWEAEANTLLIYNFTDALVDTGKSDSTEMLSRLEIIISIAAVGAVATGLAVVRRRKKKRN